MTDVETVFGGRNSNNELGVHFLNVGQGDAIYIDAPNKNSMLIDSGPQNEKVITEIHKFKNMFDRNISALLITHADADHIGSMKKVVEDFNYQAFIFSGLKSSTNIFQDLVRVVDEEHKSGREQIILTAGMTIVLDKQRDIKFEVLFPDFEYQINLYKSCKEKESEVQNIKPKSKSKLSTASKVKAPSRSKTKKNTCLKFINLETNLNSIVGRLSYGSTSFMLTGDAPIEVEQFILSKYAKENNTNLQDSKSSNRLQSDVLKLGHHGSKTSTSREFLEIVGPQYAIVSAGKDNRYGHPHKKVLDTITELGNMQLEILRTDVDGTISFYSDGSTIDVEL